MIIGFSGRLRSGKDTAGEVLTAAGWYHGSFAKAIKLFVYRLNPIIPSPECSRNYRLAELVDFEGWESVKDRYPEARALLQRCGMDAGRATLGNDVWVNAAMAAVPEGEDAVFTDVRFPNEADAIRARGGIVVRVERPGYGPNSGEHPSESSMDGYGFDAVLTNDGTLTELQQQVVDLVRASATRLAVGALRD